MNWAFGVLGIANDADERTIKRAYAQRLRGVRPDTDPEGFQALHEAYQAALNAIRWRDAHPAPQMQSWQAASVEANDADDDDAPSDKTFDRDGDFNVSDHISTERIGTASIALDRPAPDRIDPRRIDDASSREPSRGSDRVHDMRDDDHAWDADANTWKADASVDHSLRRQTPPPLPLAEEEDDWDDSFSDHIAGDTVALADACIAQASRHDPTELSTWLHARPEFWSLQLKTNTATVVFMTLEARTPAPTIASQNLETLLGFFGLNEIGREIDGYRLERMRRRIRQAWLLRASMQGAPRYGERMAFELQRPYRPFDSILRGMMPGRPAAVGRLLAALDVDGFGGIPPECDSRQVAFWQAASDPARFSLWRLAIDFGRALVASLLLALLGAVALIGMSQANGGEWTWPASSQLLWAAPDLHTQPYLYRMDALERMAPRLGVRSLDTAVGGIGILARQRLGAHGTGDRAQPPDADAHHGALGHALSRRRPFPIRLVAYFRCDSVTESARTRRGIRDRCRRSRSRSGVIGVGLRSDHLRYRDVSFTTLNTPQ